MARPRLRLLGLLFAAAPVIAAAAWTAPAPAFPDSAIVPSRSIGPYHLGMTTPEIQALRRTAPCDVTPSYVDGRVVRLETNCGGAYRTPEAVQVGDGPTRMLAAYGTPVRRSESHYGRVRGEWLFYPTGIAFRLVYGDPGSALIQAIAVFRGTVPYQVREVPPVLPPSIPLPNVGD